MDAQVVRWEERPFEGVSKGWTLLRILGFVVTRAPFSPSAVAPSGPHGCSSATELNGSSESAQ